MRAWLADVLARIADHPARRIAQLLPWNCKATELQAKSARSRPTLPAILTGCLHDG